MKMQMIPAPIILLACKIMQGMRNVKNQMERCSFVVTRGNVSKQAVAKRKIVVFLERVAMVGVNLLLELVTNVWLQKAMVCVQQMSVQNSIRYAGAVSFSQLSFYLL